MSMTVSSDPENQEHYSVHLLMGTKRGKKWLVEFSSSAFFFFFLYPGRTYRGYNSLHVCVGGW